MSERSLAVSTGSGPATLRVYAHCTATTAPDLQNVRTGAVTFLLINLDAVEQPVELPDGSVVGASRQLYQVTADALDAKQVQLSGMPLTASATGQPPELGTSIVPLDDAHLQLPGHSYAFVVQGRACD
jgi:hypothetical protein